VGSDFLIIINWWWKIRKGDLGCFYLARNFFIFCV